MPDKSVLLEDRFEWGSRDTQPTVHLVDFDTDEPTRIFHDYDNRSLCGHWNEFDDADQPDGEVACTNCIRAALSREIVNKRWAEQILEDAGYITDGECGYITEGGSPCDLAGSREDGRCHHHTECEDERDVVPVSS